MYPTNPYYYMNMNYMNYYQEYDCSSSQNMYQQNNGYNFYNTFNTGFGNIYNYNVSGSSNNSSYTGNVIYE